MPSSRTQQRLLDIISNCDRISSYIKGMTFEAFAADTKTYDAVCYCFIKIAEASSKLGHQAAMFAPDQPWPSIRSVGNRLRHEYDKVDIQAIWLAATQDLDSLKRDCEIAAKAIDV